ncbi:sugar phosphate isomerase/epimerase family protein [Botrimarina hoheduenensis]|uniref:Xylose isomerase-like TIM barrel n=1 Tax=Botrimarina hoheduenensis TaxID=2528000 RepID=A0A5C5W7M6_9BACT|nr:sugar phosphate isomerase/epimerase family protein [Botrimarina hoheduenensis]TWT46888.1 Xylose isomerase-like TIM barrel [Botrimarina hoheduenensis]
MTHDPAHSVSRDPHSSASRHPEDPAVNRPLLDRRGVLKAAVGSAGLMAFPGLVRAAETKAPPRRYCAFIKFVQQYSFDELSERIAAAGFDGVEATVRKEGYILPEEAPDRLPALVEALTKNGLELTVSTTDILRADQPHAEALLRTASQLGAPTYRLGFYRYDKHTDLRKQIANVNAAMVELAAMNHELGLNGVYQNHSGPDYVGAPVWDLPLILEGVSPREVGIAFDIRHATIEGGLAWPLHYRVAKPWLRVLYAKDFFWDGRKAEHAPMGQGLVDPKFYKQVAASGYDGAVSVHVEYLRKEGPEANMQALATDLKALKGLLEA